MKLVMIVTVVMCGIHPPLQAILGADVSRLLADDPENHAIRWQLNSVLPNVLTLANGNQLVATTALRAYVNQQITLNVTAIDNGTPNAATSAVLSVLVASVEEAPLAFTVNNLSPVAETASLGTTVAVLEARDADLTNNVTLRLTTTGFGRFSITPTVCMVCSSCDEYTGAG
jgi:hypothetical protein